MSSAIERLELLLPELAHTAQMSAARSRNLQEYALAYVERYRGDVLQLEHEWEVLHTALMQAWRKEHYAVVVRLIAGLAHSISRMSSLEEAGHILHMGIAASRYTQDRPRLAYFLNRLGNLFFSHGQYARGRRIWYASLQLVESTGTLAEMLEPLSSFAQIADILGNYTASQQLVETLSHASQGSEPISLAVATFIRAFHARHVPALDNVYDDLCHCLRLLASQVTDSALSSYRQLFTIVVQIELARVQRDYNRSHAYMETALTLARLFADRYTVAVLLLDQRLFAQELGYAPPMALFRPNDGPQPIETFHIYERQPCSAVPATIGTVGTVLSSPTESIQPTTCAATCGLIEPLSARELAVLQRVALGHSNREIAHQLVITPGTVKKHLEHIYSKLNVHNRTAAIARVRTLNSFSQGPQLLFHTAENTPFGE